MQGPEVLALRITLRLSNPSNALYCDLFLLRWTRPGSPIIERTSLIEGSIPPIRLGALLGERVFNIRSGDRDGKVTYRKNGKAVIYGSQGARYFSMHL